MASDAAKTPGTFAGRSEGKSIEYRFAFGLSFVFYLAIGVPRRLAPRRFGVVDRDSRQSTNLISEARAAATAAAARTIPVFFIV